jgi:hypothetical protein
MNWAWLNSPIVLLLGLIAAMIGIGQFLWSVACRAIQRHAEARAIAPAPSPGLSGQPARTSEVIKVSDSDFAFARD